MKTLTYLLQSYRELLKEGVRRHIYMRKLRFAVTTADQLWRITHRRYYVVHDINGDPTIVTAQQINNLKDAGVLPKNITNIDLMRDAIYIPFELTEEYKKKMGLK